MEKYKLSLLDIIMDLYSYARAFGYERDFDSSLLSDNTTLDLDTMSIISNASGKVSVLDVFYHKDLSKSIFGIILKHTDNIVSELLIKHQMITLFFGTNRERLSLLASGYFQKINNSKITINYESLTITIN